MHDATLVHKCITCLVLDEVPRVFSLGIIYLKYLWTGENATCTMSIGHEGKGMENDLL